MKVTLTAYTPDPIRQMYLAAKRCTTATLDVNEEVDREEMERVVKNCIKAGHLTVCEFATFNFHIEQITRSCSHQLVRHRHASFCQQSQRRVILGSCNEYTPIRRYLEYGGEENLIKAKEATDRLFRCESACAVFCCARAFSSYWEMAHSKASPEQARAVLPECTYTNLMMSVNFRELMHICALRLCYKAEAEIRELCLKMMEAVADIQGGMLLCAFLRPKCFQNERCSEAKPCGVFKWEK